VSQYPHAVLILFKIAETVRKTVGAYKKNAHDAGSCRHTECFFGSSPIPGNRLTGNIFAFLADKSDGVNGSGWSRTGTIILPLIGDFHCLG
jgi:hypothetical protein